MLVKTWAFGIARKVWGTVSRPGLLGRLSQGRGGRAVLVLIGVFLVPVVLCGLIWLLGLVPIFDSVRWIPIGLVIIVGLVSITVLFAAFGVWGVGASSGRDTGDQFTGDFRPLVAFGLGWLRWFMQIVMIGGIMLAFMAVWTDLRWWRLVSTPEIDALPARAATMPVPADWSPAGTATGDDPDNPYPNGYYERRYDVPASYTFARMRDWMSGPGWANDPGGAAFGALQAQHCVSVAAHCTAELTPAPGELPRYTVHAWFSRARSEAGTPQVRLRLTYAEYDPAKAAEVDVSRETLERAALIPVPAGWNRINVSGEPSENGENYVQTFAVPRSYTGRDLKAWLTGPAWTHPATGKAFGAVTMSYPCKKLDDHYLCSMTVAEPGSGGPVESLLVSYTPGDHTVRIDFERNG